MKDFEDVEDKLVNKIELEKYQIELADLRKKGDLAQISDKEKEVMQLIFDNFSHFPHYQENLYKLDNILYKNQTQCMSKNVVCHVLLEKLGIKHNILNIP